MANRETQSGGKRLKKKGGGGAKAALIALAAAVVIVAGAYTALCAYAGGRILPNSEAADVDVGGMRVQDALDTLEQVSEDYRRETVCLRYDQVSIPCDLEQAGFGVDGGKVVEQLGIGERSFLSRGAAWLSAMLRSEPKSAVDVLVFQNQDYLSGLLDELTAALTQPVIQHQAEVTDDEVVLTRGQEGLALDVSNLEDALLERLRSGDTGDVLLEPEITQPEALDLEELRRQITVEPVDAHLDPQTYEITPSVTGVSFDLAAAQALFERTEPGQECRVPLVYTEPEMTTEELQVSLFRDLLGEYSTTVTGSSNRVSNVHLAASKINEAILLPGDEFSYWRYIGACTAANGFLPAPTYLNGMTVNSIGGGLCQVSSTTYAACLAANLEIVERRCHSFAPTYLPLGSDAMVSEGSSDYRFKNNTGAPLKVVAWESGRKLTVQLWGTKKDDTYVQMEFKELSTSYPTTTYKMDETVPVGSTKEYTSAYTGHVVEAYRCVYDGSGSLISRTYESKSYYSKRDRVILVNPADAYQYGIEGAIPPEETEEPLPSGDTPPAETTPAESSETPDASGPPAPSAGATPSDPAAVPSDAGATPSDANAAPSDAAAVPSDAAGTAPAEPSQESTSTPIPDESFVQPAWE